ncbi:MAG TPA: DUF4337 family protein [Candidatus Tumulicola sp.]
MSEGGAHKALSDASGLQRTAESGHRATAVIIAIIAVLAALGTLFTHHRSISALTAKNQAILAQARASDAYGKYDAKQVRYQVAQVLIASGLPRTAEGRRVLQALADRERDSSAALLAKAQALEASSEEDDTRSEKVLKSYETLQFGTTFFEISIVLASISTLVRARAFLSVACALSVVGIVLLIYGYFQAG